MRLLFCGATCPRGEQGPAVSIKAACNNIEALLEMADQLQTPGTASFLSQHHPSAFPIPIVGPKTDKVRPQDAYPGIPEFLQCQDFAKRIVYIDSSLIKLKALFSSPVAGRRAELHDVTVAVRPHLRLSTWTSANGQIRSCQKLNDFQSLYYISIQQGKGLLSFSENKGIKLSS